MNRREKIWDILFPFFLIYICMAAMTVAVMLAAGLVTGVQDPVVLQEEVRSIPLLVSSASFLLVLILTRKMLKTDNLRFWLEQNRFTPAETVLSCLAVACFGHLTSSLIRLSGLMEVFTGYSDTAVKAFEGQNIFLLILSTVILGPAAEEIIFRAMTYRRARAHLGIIPGTIVSAVLFGLYHANMIQFVYAFLLGLLLAWLYEKSRCLGLAVSAHMCVNLWAVFSERILSFAGADEGTGFAAVLLAEAVLAAASLIRIRSGHSRNN